MHEGAYRFIARTADALEPRLWVVELGARTVVGDWPYSGPVRPLFTDARHYVGVDIAEGPNVDFVGNAATWRGPVADTVVCCETLEHTDEAEAICHNAHGMLGPGGVFLLTTAGEGRAPHSAVDGGPLRDGEFYRNVSRAELRKWLDPFRFVLIDASTPGDIYALAVK
jgi:hypothetical protein